MNLDLVVVLGEVDVEKLERYMKQSFISQMHINSILF